MNYLIRLPAVGLLLVLAGCGPKEPEPSVITEQDKAALRRVELFGAAATAADITWRPSGLGIRILAPGEGVAPQVTDVIRVHYKGRLKDGHVFDDSHARGKPSDFVLNRMITGLAAGIPVLKPGGRAEFFIPPSLGYGGMRSGDIPPVSGLIFEVELIAVNPEPAPKS